VVVVVVVVKLPAAEGTLVMFVTLLADGIEEDGGGHGGGFPSGQSPLASGRLPSAQTSPWVVVVVVVSVVPIVRLFSGVA